MSSTTRWGIRLALAVLAWVLAGPAAALSPEQIRALALGDNDERIEALSEAAATGDPALGPYIEALLADEVRTVGDDQVFIVRGNEVRNALTGEPAPLPDNAEEVVNSNRIRRALQAALAALKLFSDDAAVRSQAIAQMQRETLDEEQLPVIEKVLERETDDSLRERLLALRATALVTAEDPALRLEAAVLLGRSNQPTVRALLRERLAQDGDSFTEPDAQVRAALKKSLSAVDNRLAWGERAGVLFSGISLGSILLLVALGLAITYGLMGVINMAHGEMMMIGAYATYVVQNLFRTHLPGWFDWYVLAAVPVAFLASALVGAVLERSVIRWLYGRPLETLLATWGISLILIQAVRSLFGAQNVQVDNPTWLSGGVALMPNLTLPYNRMAIIVFASLVVVGVALLIARTRLGLFVRGVTQNRPMAACMGVNTARIDTYAFALGAGIAGLAGCALSQVGNVGPDLGQSYIVDSFLVVVTGGVGQLAGTVYAAMGLGVINKLLEGWQGAVLAKIMVLLLIVAFIQKRPQGLFAMKGRSAEA
ncbi:urea ABC transporter permease subunit UrtB [Caldimonas caldifontis]|uniref:urea ABC transporter permease subunit UrtB n=1 Tax=Caldimonas caldifontis TaxID=1452508 RepID=UPI001FE5F198|nr:urea ABC transporter permease subunit UrtB [Caldimonas caldifontis]